MGCAEKWRLVAKGGKLQSYRDLEIYELAFKLAVEIHKMTLSLPNYEQYEEGRQIRKSSKSIPATVAEGFGRRQYKQEFIKFLTYAHSSCDETLVHLDLLHHTGLLEKTRYQYFKENYDKLGKKVYYFLSSVIEGHNKFE